MNIQISAQMESAEAASRLRGHLESKGVDATIVDGGKVVAEDVVGAGTLIASHFYDFLRDR